ncbi:hypothetical protein PUN28_020105 [Cardiocondyla obscurior]|uniref:Secreted protein n=1 Tax=Cardiocondyla obscurior TaxID=286306 RepID=A0AAW2E8L5_9HYME
MSKPESPVLLVMTLQQSRAACACARNCARIAGRAEICKWRRPRETYSNHSPHRAVRSKPSLPKINVAVQ